MNQVEGYGTLYPAKRPACEYRHRLLEDIG